MTGTAPEPNKGAAPRTTMSGAGARPTTGAAGPGVSRQLATAMEPALDYMRKSPGVQRHTAYYRAPWFMLAGSPGASEALLRAGHASADGAGPSGVADRNGWGWWLLPGCACIALGDDLVRSKEEDAKAWATLEAALALLIERRRRLPLNGFVATVSVEVLADTEGARKLGNALHAVIEEGYRQIRNEFPVSVVVTGLERLPGHAGFFAHLPRALDRQVIGHVNEPVGAVDQPEVAFAAAFDPIVERLEAIRLGLLLDLLADLERPAIFRFVEAVAGLRGGLLAFARALFARGTFSAAPRWRGLYFAAPEALPPSPRHIGDLFSRFLPQDAGLVGLR